MGIEGDYKFDFASEYETCHDWINTIAPASVLFENESFMINGQYGKVMYIEEYPKHIYCCIICLCD